MTFINIHHKSPETVWPLRVFMTLQDENGEAIDVSDVRTDLFGIAAESPVVGDEVVIRIANEFQIWSVAHRQWSHVVPAEGQMTPCSVLHIGLRSTGRGL